MGLSLRPASEDELAASESLSRLNMVGYRASRGVSWDTERFRLSWDEFENLAIVHGSERCGFIRLMPEGGALAIRDIQIAPAFQRRGIGAWAIAQVMHMAALRGYPAVQLRVYPENPAMALYCKLGFSADRVEDAVVHMRCPVPPNKEPNRPGPSLPD